MYIYIVYRKGNKQKHIKCNLLPPVNEVWGKVMFLHLSVILLTGVCPTPLCGCRPRPRLGQTPPPLGLGRPHGCRPPGDRTDHPWMQTPGVRQAPSFRYGQQAGGTHPTGMHTCFAMIVTAICHGNLLHFCDSCAYGSRSKLLSVAVQCLMFGE